jgi:hypothetical protein
MGDVMENNSKQVATIPMLLPEQMNFNVKQALSSKHNIDELSFKTIFIKNLKDENGQIVPDLIQPRFIHIYSENDVDNREAVHYVKKILGDAFDYQISEGSDLPSDELKQAGIANSIPLTYHFRSRCFHASVINNQFKNMQTQECVSNLLKSTYSVHIQDLVTNGKLSYTAIGTFFPKTANFISNSGIISFSNPVEALERLLKDEHLPYNKIIDLNFDTVVVKFKEFEGEFEAPQDANAFVDFFRKNIIAHAVMSKDKLC